MKRYFSSEAKSSTKRPRQLEIYGHEMRLLIPASLAGVIIGKGGKNIGELRNKTDGIISVPNSQSMERVLIIKTKVAEDTLAAYYHTMDLIEADAIENGNQQFNTKLQEHNVRLLLPRSQIGGLIGPGGSKITKMRDRTHARIKVHGVCCPGSTERVVEISGRSKNVKDALEEIISNCPDSGDWGEQENTQYDPNDYDALAAPSYGGYVRGGDGSTRRTSSVGSSTTIKGRQSKQWQWHNHDFHKSVEPLFRSAQHLMQTCQVSVPTVLISQIIGPGGLQIQQTRNESNADIIVEEAKPGSSECIITIVGTVTEIKLAQDLLRRSVRVAPSRYSI